MGSNSCHFNFASHLTEDQKNLLQQEQILSLNRVHNIIANTDYCNIFAANDMLRYNFQISVF